MLFSTRTYELKGTTRILGSQASDPKIHRNYIGSKAPTAEKGDEEAEKLPEIDENKGVTVFFRDNDCLCIGAHVIKGFLKEALSTLKGQVEIASVSSKVDNLVSVSPDYIRLKRDGEPIKEPDGLLERPLRAMTMQGPRTSLASSEYLDSGWTIKFDITLLDNNGTAKSKPLTWEAIEEAFNYGMLFKGLGQWRNAQYGRFTWKCLEKDESENKKNAA